jgi:prevent-host-death family protein
MSKSTVHQAKTQLSRLIEEAERGEEVVILRGKTPVARIIPVKAAPKRRKLDIMKGAFVVGPEFFEPLSEEELNEWGL